MVGIAVAVLVVVYIIILELRLHDIKEDRVVNINRDEHGNVRTIATTSGTMLLNGVTTTKETVLKDRISELEDRISKSEDELVGINNKISLEEENIREGTIVKAQVCWGAFHRYYYDAIFIVTECNRETLRKGEIVGEDTKHQSQAISAIGIESANEEERKKFIQEYNDYADKLKIEISSEDD